MECWTKCWRGSNMVHSMYSSELSDKDQNYCCDRLINGAQSSDGVHGTQHPEIFGSCLLRLLGSSIIAFFDSCILRFLSSSIFESHNDARVHGSHARQVQRSSVLAFFGSCVLRFLRSSVLAFFGS